MLLWVFVHQFLCGHMFSFTLSRSRIAGSSVKCVSNLSHQFIYLTVLHLTKERKHVFIFLYILMSVFFLTRKIAQYTTYFTPWAFVIVFVCFTCWKFVTHPGNHYKNKVNRFFFHSLLWLCNTTLFEYTITYSTTPFLPTICVVCNLLLLKIMLQPWALCICCFFTCGGVFKVEA